MRRRNWTSGNAMGFVAYIGSFVPFTVGRRGYAEFLPLVPFSTCPFFNDTKEEDHSISNETREIDSSVLNLMRFSIGYQLFENFQDGGGFCNGFVTVFFFHLQLKLQGSIYWMIQRGEIWERIDRSRSFFVTMIFQKYVSSIFLSITVRDRML